MRRLVLACALVAASLALGQPLSAQAVQGKGRPNIVLVTVDDMRDDDMRYMDFTRNLIARHGMSYESFISPHPLCCPARAEMMTGQYAQNNGVWHNAGPHGGYEHLRASNLLPNWLRSAGYSTGAVGKFMNGWKGERLRGLDDNELFSFAAHNSYGYRAHDSGRHPKTHTTRFTGKRSSGLIRKYGEKRAPFFVWSSFLAPHSMRIHGRWAPPTAPPGYSVRAEDATPQSFDSAAMEDSQAARDRAVRLHRARVASLYAVDDSIRLLVRTLRKTREWGNTRLIFTSDNGFLLGEHSKFTKNVPWREALDVPFAIVGGQVGTSSALVTTVDLASTVTDIANVRPGLPQDGRSVLAYPDGYSYALVQGGGNDGGWAWRGVRTREWTYAEYADGSELVLEHDSDEVLNHTYNVLLLEDLRAKLDQVENCVGTGCWQ